MTLTNIRKKEERSDIFSLDNDFDKWQFAFFYYTDVDLWSHTFDFFFINFAWTSNKRNDVDV